jgi:hypothetical protein
METIIWILAAYWLAGSIARGVIEYGNDLEYAGNRSSAIAHGAVWALIWPVV